MIFTNFVKHLHFRRSKKIVLDLFVFNFVFDFHYQSIYPSITFLTFTDEYYKTYLSTVDKSL